MIGEAGQFCLVMALLFSLSQWGSGCVAYFRNNPRFLALTETTTLLQGGFLLAAFLLLMLGFYVNDYSLLSVAMNSHDDLPLLYRLAATWGHHEGSLLLWVLILGLMGVLLRLFQHQRIAEYPLILGIQGLITVSFLGFMLFASNPFHMLPVPFLEGESLNPLLQDRGLALHPPFLYAGYVGFSLAFSFGVAVLISGKLTREWAETLRTWVLLAWASLSIGVALGSWWAYYELGWGGYWFWDPVENASLLPWLLATALIHTIKVTKKQNRLQFTTVFLSLATFILSLLGTFLVRSGLISSVHAFASDPLRGQVILWILSVYIVVAAVLLTWRGRALIQGQPISVWSREGGLMLCGALLTAGCFIVLLGTFYPLIVELWGGGPLSIGEPYYTKTFVPLMIPLVLIMPMGLFMVWANDSLKIAWKQMKPVLSMPLLGTVVALYLMPPAHLMSYLGVALGLWVVGGSALHLYKRRKWGTGLSHLGFGIAVLAMVVASTWEDHTQQPMTPGDHLEFKGYKAKLSSVEQGQGPNYLYEEAALDVSKGNGNLVTTLTPQKRLYKPQDILLSETSIYSNGLMDLYGVLGAYQGESTWLVRLQYHPMIAWIWWGIVIMALGGTLNALKRKKKA